MKKKIDIETLGVKLAYRQLTNNGWRLENEVENTDIFMNEDIFVKIYVRVDATAIGFQTVSKISGGNLVSGIDTTFLTDIKDVSAFACIFKWWSFHNKSIRKVIEKYGDK